MAEPQPPQSFDNHAKTVPGYHYALFGILVLNALWRGAWAFRVFTGRVLGFSRGEATFDVLVAVALFLLAWYTRIFPLTVQDRIIRLEMRLRLREVLPAELHPRIHELTRGQLVALRFASDAELPELVREVLGGSLKEPREIKRRVKDWQPDHLRA